MLELTVTSVAFADADADAGLKAPPGHSGPVPAGLAFVEWLRESLVVEVEGVGVGEFPWVTYAGHGIEVSYTGSRFDLVVELSDRETAAWNLTLEPRKGFLPFRRKAGRVAGFTALSQRLQQHLQRAPMIDATIVTEAQPQP